MIAGAKTAPNPAVPTPNAPARMPPRTPPNPAPTPINNALPSGSPANT